MSTCIAHANTILIVCSVLSSVYSSPTRNQESELDYEEYSRCFDLDGHPNSELPTSISQFAVDSEGRSCFVSFDSHRYPNLLHVADKIDIRFANMTRELCPMWSKSKQCLMDHLNGHRCNEDDRKEAINFKSLNEEIVFAELLCNPKRQNDFINSVKNMLKENLWDCFELENFKSAFEDCIRAASRADDPVATFQDHARFFGCVTPGLRQCTNEDPVKERKLVQIWEEFAQTFLETHRDFWN